jgi:MoaA/NifB/PqqE/SkfB family radical SAM enzyme
MYKLDNDLKYTWKQKIKNPVQPRSWSCMAPHYRITIDYMGRVFLCHDCWVPFPVGHITEFSNIDQIFQHPVAKKIQQNTMKGSNFKFCDTKICHINYDNPIGMDKLEINVGIDESCNLRCPSCRTELLYVKQGESFTKKILAVEHLLKLIQNYDRPARILIGSNGDAFASHVYQYFYSHYEVNSNHAFILKTNGLKIKDITNIAFLKQINQLQISIDAGSEQVYEKVRLGGKWSKLVESLKYTKELGIMTQLYFVVQKDNLYDIDNFVALCDQYNFKGHITGLEDWGTWPQFIKHRVHVPGDDLFDEWQQIKSNIKSNRIVCNI